ncbi:MAG: hypothetical protein IPJ06_04895 [Saprospiraceae bacterium]|nr:hypothetical protein [Saprospiraceae bacterium]
MKRIKELQNMIEDALHRNEYLELYYSKPFRTSPNSDKPIGGSKLESTKEILQAATELLQHYTYKFIDEVDKPEGRKALLASEIHTTSKLLLLPKFSCFTVERKRLDFLVEDLMEGLANGRVYGDGMNVCLPAYLAKCWYLGWLESESEGLKDEVAQEQAQITPPKYLLKWNGTNNGLADIFRQLKGFANKKNKPLLDETNESIALFLKNNFECYRNTKVSTIKNLLERQSSRQKRVIRISI